MRLRAVERWISVVRLIAFPFVIALVALSHYPPGWDVWAWSTTACFGSGALSLFALARADLSARHPLAQSLLAQVFDSAVATAYVLVFSAEAGTPVQQILYIDLAAACVRFEILGGLIIAVASAPIVAGFERLRVDRLHIPYSWKLVVVQTGFETTMALIVGWLVRRLVIEGAAAEARACEAEQLRDELARRAELADAAYESERRTSDELRRLSSLRADFVSMISHEVRTPLAAVIGSARTLRGRWRELSHEQRDAFLGLIGDEVDRLAVLVGEVLDSSKIDEGTFSYSFAELDLALLVSESVAAAEIGHDGLCIATSLPPSLPAVRGDSIRLRQVLGNLIDNAAKYSPEGSTIQVRALASNGHACVEVVDEGGGIALEDQEHIFEKFSRVRGAQAKPGSGLGLYIARAIAEAHEGALEVRSTLGEGSTFTLRLPARV